MKKVFMIAMSVVLTFGMFSCGNKAAEKAQHEADSIEAARINDSIAAAEEAALLEAQALLDSLRADSIQKAFEDSVAAALAASKNKVTKTVKTTTKTVKETAEEAAAKAEKLAQEAESTIKAVDAKTEAAKEAVAESNKTIKRRVK